MKLEGIHHVTAITADAQSNVDFYAGVLGLRLVKKTVNQDAPNVYHLFYADQEGHAGSDITFFEYPGAPIGRAGAGMVHQIGWRVGSAEALDFWADRLGDRDIAVSRVPDRLSFADPEGLRHELAVATVADAPLIADHPEVPADFALQGFDNVRAYSANPEASRGLLEDVLGFTESGDGHEARGQNRGGIISYDAPPEKPGLQAAGTVHHVAWASTMDDHVEWLNRLREAGHHPTDVIDRFYFRSIYFREPSGVLFEIATLGPGFTSDEPPESLGEHLSLPPRFESMRAEVEANLKPVDDHSRRPVAQPQSS
ncbi:MAG: glyoxalase family protein [Thermoleophilaceae bacterium]|nr:glyoxalase family protein [Thermoleophilaceae bacterium]